MKRHWTFYLPEVGGKVMYLGDKQIDLLNQVDDLKVKLDRIDREIQSNECEIEKIVLENWNIKEIELAKIQYKNITNK